MIFWRYLIDEAKAVVSDVFCEECYFDSPKQTKEQQSELILSLLILVTILIVLLREEDRSQVVSKHTEMLIL